jgi:Amt family ammonium transporter
MNNLTGHSYYSKAEVDALVLLANQSIDIIWMTTSTVFILMMQLGFAMLEAGSIRSKNMSSVLLKSVIDFILGSVVFYLIGFGLMNN